MGNDLSLIQASGGNTSIKLDGKLLVKASGKKLKNALNEDIFVSLDLIKIRNELAINKSKKELNFIKSEVIEKIIKPERMYFNFECGDLWKRENVDKWDDIECSHEIQIISQSNRCAGAPAASGCADALG